MKGTTPKGTSPKGVSPKGASPKGASLKGVSPKGTSPKGASPKGTPPKGTSPKAHLHHSLLRVDSGCFSFSLEKALLQNASYKSHLGSTSEELRSPFRCTEWIFLLRQQYGTEIPLFPVLCTSSSLAEAFPGTGGCTGLLSSETFCPTLCLPKEAVEKHPWGSTGSLGKLPALPWGLLEPDGQIPTEY